MMESGPRAALLRRRLRCHCVPACANPKLRRRSRRSGDAGARSHRQRRHRPLAVLPQPTLEDGAECGVVLGDEHPHRSETTRDMGRRLEVVPQRGVPPGRHLFFRLGAYTPPEPMGHPNERSGERSGRPCPSAEPGATGGSTRRRPEPEPRLASGDSLEASSWSPVAQLRSSGSRWPRNIRARRRARRRPRLHCFRRRSRRPRRRPRRHPLRRARRERLRRQRSQRAVPRSPHPQRSPRPRRRRRSHPRRPRRPPSWRPAGHRGGRDSVSQSRVRIARGSGAPKMTAMLKAETG